jgi:hypothetical protein
MSRAEDTVQWRIVVEFGRKYVYLTMTDSTGKLLAEFEECFTQPFLLDRKDARDETVDAWHMLYDHLNETIVFPLPEGGGDSAQSDKED